jgi:putative transposase
MNNPVLELRQPQRFALWKELHAQVCQDGCRRVDVQPSVAIQRCFHQLAKGRPKFKKARRYAAFTFPQSGYQVDGNTVTIEGVKSKLVKQRQIGGQIQTLTVKPDAVGRLGRVFRVIENADSASPTPIEPSSTGKSGGFDFGLKTFLVEDQGRS